MTLFSQRHGHKPLNEQLQRDSVNAPLRNGLWTACTVIYWDVWEPEEYGVQSPHAKETQLLATRTWLHYFKKPIDTMPEVKHHLSSAATFVDKLREYFFKCPWYEVYDLLEFICINGPEDRYDTFADMCNRFLKTEMSAFRLVNKEVTPITDDTEIAAVEKASGSPFAPANEHLSTAIRLLSDRSTPDYRNSIKESISAVESVCATIVHRKGATLGDALTHLDKSMHPALVKAFSNLYGYTSDASGIRHALLDEANLTFADAKFMLVACSGFINYVIEKTTENRTS